MTVDEIPPDLAGFFDASAEHRPMSGLDELMIHNHPHPPPPPSKNAWWGWSQS